MWSISFDKVFILNLKTKLQIPKLKIIPFVHDNKHMNNDNYHPWEQMRAIPSSPFENLKYS